MQRIYNFSPGPSMLPLPVLEKAQAQLTDYQGTGMSVMEMSHRSKAYMAIIEDAQRKLRKLMQIPDNYKVLFIQGGASMQFAMVPMNLAQNKKADYIISGNFANNAYKEGKRVLNARAAASSQDVNFCRIPSFTRDDLDPQADYVHICTNNTIFGTCYPEVPDTGDIPLVADMSSDILSKPYDVGKFGVIYAGAQKNLGPAGFAVVIIREDLIGREPSLSLPAMLQYKTYAENDSMYNTPPTYAIYVASLVMDWLLEMGGLQAVHQHNLKKAAILYDYLDSSSFYTATADKTQRSIMNVPFTTPSKELDQRFIAQAAQQGLATLAGHRLVGGMRASIYNAMPLEGVQALADFMQEFERSNG